MLAPKTRLLFCLFLIGYNNFCCTDSNERTVTIKEDKIIVTIKKNGVPVVDSIFNKNSRLKEVDQYFVKEARHIKSKITYYGDDPADSLILEFSPTGVMKSKKRHYGNSMPVEESRYSSSGKISSYLFYDQQENKSYQKNYSEGRIIGEIGVPFFAAYLSPAKENFSINDSIKALFIAPTPPGYETRLYTYQSGKSYNNIYQIDSTAMFRVQIYPLEIGNYTWSVYMELKEKSSANIIKSTSIIINYSVK